jgi:hypothetical protein
VDENQGLRQIFFYILMVPCLIEKPVSDFFIRAQIRALSKLMRTRRCLPNFGARGCFDFSVSVGDKWN